jgi:Fungal chitosanase of glycosyl hydrolase group 75
MGNSLTQIDKVNGIAIWSVEGEPKSFIYKAGLAVDADGNPAAYGPNNAGIDYTADGGNPTSGAPGAWWGGPVDLNHRAIVQKIYEPFPGFYVSGTALVNPAYPEESQYRYIDAGSIPFIVLPGNHQNGAKLGDVCLCFNEDTGDNCYGIFADVGPSSEIGEASMRMALALSLDDNPKNGGTSSKRITYLVFPGSVGTWKPPHVWWDAANTLTKAWGGLSRLHELLSVI